MNWKPLTKIAQLQEIKENSFQKSQLIFKHSTRCGISRMVLRNFESNFNLQEDEMDCYYLDLLNFRTISNEIANIFEVTHQSPQVLVIKDNIVIYTNSHDQIDANLIAQLVDN